MPRGIEEYHLKFERPERLTHNELHGNLLSDEVTVIAENTDTLALNYEYFKVDAITMLNLKSRSIKLRKMTERARFAWILTALTMFLFGPDPAPVIFA